MEGEVEIDCNGDGMDIEDAEIDAEIEGEGDDRGEEDDGDDDDDSDDYGGGGKGGESDSDDGQTFDDLDTYQPSLFTPCSLHIPANEAVGRAGSIALQITSALTPILTELRIWLRLKIPCYLEGDNLGYDIILTHHDGLVSCQNALSMLQRNVGQYRHSRAQALATFCTALPMNDDALEVIRLLDKDIFGAVAYIVPNSVNMCLGIYDALGKNMAKISQPRERDREEERL